MILTLAISAVLAIILGIAVLIFPKLLRWAIGFYLIISGILMLVNQYSPNLSPY